LYYVFNKPSQYAHRYSIELISTEYHTGIQQSRSQKLQNQIYFKRDYFSITSKRITHLIIHFAKFQSFSENAVPIAHFKLMWTNLNQKKKKISLPKQRQKMDH
jgi:hypothetical protein